MAINGDDLLSMLVQIVNQATPTTLARLLREQATTLTETQALALAEVVVKHWTLQDETAKVPAGGVIDIPPEIP